MPLRIFCHGEGESLVVIHAAQSVYASCPERTWRGPEQSVLQWPVGPGGDLIVRC